jgi:signal transduction histidine kinase
MRSERSESTRDNPGNGRRRSLRSRLWLWLSLAACTPLALLQGLVPGTVPLALTIILAAVSVLVSAWLAQRAVRPLLELERACRLAGEATRCEVPAGAPAEVAHVADRVTSLAREREAARRLAARHARQSQVQVSLRRALRSAPTSKGLARAILHVLGAGCQARGGAFYLMQGGQRLEPAAHTGALLPGLPPAEIRLGEGLVGRVASERRMGTETAADGTRLVAIPYHLTGRVKGVAVFALARDLTDDEQDVLADTAEQVAIALDTRRARERVQLLLDETRQHAAAFAVQQRELQQTNLRLQQSDRYKNEFLANMTHELRSPLNSMLLLSQVLVENRHGRLGADEVDAAQVINKAGRELLVIIDDILDLTKAEAGRLELYPEDIEISDLAESLIALYRPLAARRGLDLRVTVDPLTSTQCRADPTRLSQILKNLLNNALKFTEFGSVSLTIRPAAEEIGDAPALDFVVSDTGIGISPEVLPALFAAFTQGDGSIARRFGGSGLGLSICRKLTELLGARMLVASEVGRGSTFTLRLPVQPVARVAEAPPPPLPAFVVPVEASPVTVPRPAARPASSLPDREPVAGLLTGQRVLMIDGDMRSVYRLTALLEAAGATVQVARDPAACLTRLDDLPPRALVLVRPQVLAGLPSAERRTWWSATIASGARIVVLAGRIPATADVPAGLPVFDPDGPGGRLCETLAGLARPGGARRALQAEEVPA